MDSLTHIALGACMGEAFAGKTLGKKAMLWGALAQSIPDIDFIASFWMDTSSNLLAHRGFTHSFLFCIIITPLFALLAEYWHRPHNISLKHWMLFFGSVIFIHIFLDAFNNYGVGWLEPFSHKRFSFNMIYVADPLFSIWTGLACLAFIYFRKNTIYRKRIWKFGLGFTAIYLLICIGIKIKIDADVKKSLQQQNINYTQYLTTPAPFQNSLWYVVAGNENGFYVGHKSIFDTKKTIDFTYFARNNNLLEAIEDKEDLYKLKRFSQNFYTIEKWNDTLVFNDLRFGQIKGWENPKGKFVFHYFLHKEYDNTLVVQRGRFVGWNEKTFSSLFERIKGN
ncbi:metal-dependent hydrolase [Flavobacterium sp.]|uniref:metal-dependent hydrolase n=1 Tax=Flavobacterium sp. TaxID=239 RepID=UPI00286DFD17|nr:metal-dependent hydrolase [Flavobacterium sp.]